MTEYRVWRSATQRHAVVVPTDLEDFFAFCARLRPTSVVLDIEPWLVGWAAPPDLVAGRLAEWRSRLPSDARVVLCTNSRRFTPFALAIGDFVGAARKPWTHRQRLGPLGPRPLVVGDSLTLDGLLARRTRGTFAWLRWFGDTPAWPRAIHVIDRMVARLVLVPTGKEENWL